jgi:hypothetical protein
MPPTPPSAPRGLSLADLVGTLGAGLLTIVVSAPSTEVDDITLAEPAQGVYGQPGDLLLAVGVEATDAAVELVEQAAQRGVGGVVLRRAAARRREVRAAARTAPITLVELSDHASWAHVVWLLRGVLDRAMAPGGAPGVAIRADSPVHDDLFALADACAALVDAPVTIEDTHSRVLAYSARQDVADPIRVSTIVGRRVPDAVLASLRGRGVFRRLARSGEPFYVPAAPDGSLKPRLVIPVRAGTEWLGSIWAVVDAPPAPEVLRPLTQTASVVALHLLRLRSQADLARRVSADRLRNVLSGNVAQAENWLPPGPWRVVVLDSGDGAAGAAGQLDMWESACRRSGWRQPLLATLDDHTVGLVTDTTGNPTPGSWTWLERVTSEVADLSPAATASAGGAVIRPAGLAPSRSDAFEVYRHLLHARATAPATAPRTLTIEQAWAAVTADRAVSGIVTHSLLGPVTELRSHDAEHGTEYLTTLAAWLDYPADPRTAARLIHVHPNTLRYRMQRLGEVIDVDLADPEVRLALRLQLRSLGH